MDVKSSIGSFLRHNDNNNDNNNNDNYNNDDHICIALYITFQSTLHCKFYYPGHWIQFLIRT